MIKNIIEKEQQYQENTINLIASDNYASKDNSVDGILSIKH